ncbi:MAG: hypothetical protein IPG91_13935 [Ideonella sp.]|nr:hypothetical protein [Ideonella sp.]
MERIEGGPFDWAQLRAVQPDAAVSLTLRSTRSPGLTVGVALRIAATPSMQPSAVAGADGGSDRLSSRRARRRARRDERRAWRERVGALRGGDRGALKEARADRRRQRQAAREQRRLATAQDDVFALRTEIDAARLRGIEACDATIAALMARPRPGSVVAKALLDIMKIDAPEISPGRERVEHVLDVLRGARNGLAAAKLSDFVAGDLDDPTELAEAQGNVRGGKVTLSSAWRLGTLQSREPARGVDDVRAFVLLHEFIHLAGPFEANEIYVFDRKAWAARSAEQLLQMADAYAALAWVVGTGEQR